MRNIVTDTFFTGFGAAAFFFVSKLFVDSGYEFVDQGVHAGFAAVGAYMAAVHTMKR